VILNALRIDHHNDRYVVNIGKVRVKGIYSVSFWFKWRRLALQVDLLKAEGECKLW
jgi:hypothetical protein